MPVRLTLRHAAAERATASLQYIGRELGPPGAEHGLSRPVTIANAAGLPRSR
ncbi:MAG: hypothetical protein U0838_15835 [Chloroflexota bacterium]